MIYGFETLSIVYFFKKREIKGLEKKRVRENEGKKEEERRRGGNQLIGELA